MRRRSGSSEALIRTRTAQLRSVDARLDLTLDATPAYRHPFAFDDWHTIRDTNAGGEHGGSPPAGSPQNTVIRYVYVFALHTRPRRIRG
jgi:hypothetical protein